METEKLGRLRIGYAANRLSADIGYTLHPVDLATNKVLALAGRDEPRDFLDILEINRDILPLGALIWAACGKDPGFTPHSLLTLLQRRGKYRPEDFSRLHLSSPVDLVSMKQEWLDSLDKARNFIDSRPPEELGCLYYSISNEAFIAPAPGSELTDVVLHYGRPGGVLPSILS